MDPVERSRIVFLGTGEFGIPSLEILHEHGYPITAVVTNPDKPAGRGQLLATSPVKTAALRLQLPLIQPESLSAPEFVDQLRALRPDLFVVVAFRILPPDVFSIPSVGAFNLHASLLPKFRGAAPIQWAIIRGEKETGVTTFLLERTVDTGNVLLQARVSIDANETAGELHDRLAEVGAEIVLHTVRLLETHKASPRMQDSSIASSAPKIFKDDCNIDWSMRAIDVHNRIRGLSPKPGAFTLYDGIAIKVYHSRVAPEAGRGPAGEILRADERLVVAAGGGAVEIAELQQEGKKRLNAAEFLRGFKLKPGSRFS